MSFGAGHGGAYLYSRNTEYREAIGEAETEGWKVLGQPGQFSKNPVSKIFKKWLGW